MMKSDPVLEMLRGSRFEERKMGSKTWVVVCTLPCGYEITESAACVDPQDFDEEIADSICRSKIRDRISELLAYEACGRGGAEKTDISLQARVDQEKRAVQDLIDREVAEWMQQKLRLMMAREGMRDDAD